MLAYRDHLQGVEKVISTCAPWPGAEPAKSPSLLWVYCFLPGSHITNRGPFPMILRAPLPLRRSACCANISYAPNGDPCYT